MDHFIDITVLPDPEFTETVLMNALFSKLHRVLGQHADGQVGVSFPKAMKTLGRQIRLHGSFQALNSLMSHAWLKGLRDYSTSTKIKPVPNVALFRTVKRVQLKSAHNKRKRSVAKGWLSVEEAFEQIPDETERRLMLPFAHIRSLSTKNMIRIYIEHGPLQDRPVDGQFSSYGLSATATIPWWE